MLEGHAPAAWTAPDLALSEIRPPAVIPVMVPSELVRRRPDILAAEADLHADTAAIGVAAADLYPDIRLTAGFTQEALTPGGLFSFGSTAYNFGPIVTVPLFHGGALRAQRRVAEAQARASLARYQEVVLTAFRQVSDQLAALANDDRDLATLAAAERTARTALEDSRNAYRLGGGPFVQIVANERELARVKLNLVEAQGRRLQDIVQLYAATAAGWRSAPSSFVHP